MSRHTLVGSVPLMTTLWAAGETPGFVVHPVDVEGAGLPAGPHSGRLTVKGWVVIRDQSIPHGSAAVEGGSLFVAKIHRRGVSAHGHPYVTIYLYRATAEERVRDVVRDATRGVGRSLGPWSLYETRDAAELTQAANDGGSLHEPPSQ